MPTCKNCPYCDVITDENFCKRLKCTKTIRWRTLTWSMCCENQNVIQYFADYVEKHDTPKWCPLLKERSETKNADILPCNDEE
jgi:hypothetical protein